MRNIQEMVMENSTETPQLAEAQAQAGASHENQSTSTQVDEGSWCVA
jgi:hypothetical protein